MCRTSNGKQDSTWVKDRKTQALRYGMGSGGVGGWWTGGIVMQMVYQRTHRATCIKGTVVSRADVRGAPFSEAPQDFVCSLKPCEKRAIGSGIELLTRVMKSTSRWAQQEHLNKPL